MAGHVELLASVPLFQRLPAKRLARLDQLMVEREYAAGETIVQEGEGGIGFFIIASGKAEVLRGANAQPVATLGPGAYFGEMAMIDDHPRSVTIRAVEPVACLVLTRWHFLAELKSDNDMAIELLHVMTERVRAAERRVEELEAKAG